MISFAEAIDGTPGWLRKSRPRGAKAQGLRYERALARALPGAKHGQWFRYRATDGGKDKFCQTDLLLARDGFEVILEAKYTWTLDGHRQIEQLYRPVVELATGRAALGIVVCKVLVDSMPQAIGARTLVVCSRLEDAVQVAKGGGAAVLHWIGGAAFAGAGAKCHTRPLAPAHLGL